MTQKHIRNQAKYERQTVEDLENLPPMSGTQKGVLALAAVFVAVMLVYFFVL